MTQVLSEISLRVLCLCVCQVDLLRPMLVHGVRTQGAKTSMGRSHCFTIQYTISYSTDQQTWFNYRGNSTKSSYVSINARLKGTIFDIYKVLHRVYTRHDHAASSVDKMYNRF